MQDHDRVTRPSPVVAPIYQSTTFELDELSYRDIRATGGLEEIWYTRMRNPTVDAAANTIAKLEGAPAGIMTSSGMAAISTTLLALCKAGSRIVAARELYGDTYDLLIRDLRSLAVEVELVRAANLDSWKRALKRPATIVFAETLSNPQLVLVDIPEIAKLAHAVDATVVIDNTFASPFAVQPLRHGADLVVNSVTKYLNGHSDVVAGWVGGSADLIREVRRRVVTFGACLDPHAAFLVQRGLKTFRTRLSEQTETARSVATFLAQTPDVKTVFYPTQSDYPARHAARKLLRNGRTGAMVSFVLEGGDPRASRFVRCLRVATEATSLGGVETLVSLPHNSSHYSLTRDELAAAGITEGMVRLSVGLEESSALISDISQALDASSIARTIYEPVPKR